MDNLQPQKNRRTVFKLAIIAILMFGFGFALVPFYNLLCKVTGINGKTDMVATGNSQTVDNSRWVTVQFVANTNASLPWEFYPLTREIKIHPGQNEQVAYYAKNNTNHTMTVQAVPSVTPGLAAKYLKKTECFCFTRQTFAGGESHDMPLIFHLEANLPKDIRTITLSYTLFDTAGLAQNSASKTPGKIG